MNAASTNLVLKRDDRIATLTLTPPDSKPPTLDPNVLAQLDQAIAEIESNLPGLVILQSASPKYFCVGANLNVLKETNEHTIVPWVQQGHRVLNRLEDLPCPVIAKVTGYALGGGLELALAADFILSGDQAKFGLTEANLGFIPGWGGSRRLAAKIGDAAAKRYFFTGQMLDATEAYRLRLVEFVGNHEQLENEMAAITKSILSCSQYAVRTFKKILNDEQRAARDRNAAVEADLSRGCLRDPNTIQRLQNFLNQKK
jgi:enoyl-CoA hydratase/carnithine racemase